MAGRKPKPTALKVIEGNPGKRKIENTEPVYQSVVSECPEFLGEIARREWDRMTELLKKSGVLTEVDTVALAAYCQLYDRWHKLESDILVEGMTIDECRYNKDGDVVSTSPKTNPKVTEARLTLQQIRAFASEFGITPSSRSRINIGQPPKEKDEMEELLSNGTDE